MIGRIFKSVFRNSEPPFMVTVYKLKLSVAQDIITMFAFNRTLLPFFEGLLPRDNPRNTRFAINFFTSIGLGGLT